MADNSAILRLKGGLSQNNVIYTFTHSNCEFDSMWVYMVSKCGLLHVLSIGAITVYITTT